MSFWHPNPVICGWTDGLVDLQNGLCIGLLLTPLILKTINVFFLFSRYLYLPPIWVDAQKDELNLILTNHVEEDKELTSPSTMISHVVNMPQCTKKEQFLVWGSISNYHWFKNTMIGGKNM